MTWGDKTIIKILLLVARIITNSQGSTLDVEIRNLANHISVYNEK